MNELRIRVGLRIRDLRLGHSLTQEQLGERAGVSYKFLGEVERGAGNPTVDWMEQIAKALDVNVEDLVSGAAPRQPVYRPLKGGDYSIVREAREALEAVLRRFDEKPDAASAPPRYARKSAKRKRR